MVNKFLLFLESKEGKRYLSKTVYSADSLSSHLEYFRTLRIKIIRVVTLTIDEDTSSIYSAL